MATTNPTPEQRKQEREAKIAEAIERFDLDPEFANNVGHIPGPLTLGQAELLRAVAAEVSEGVIVEVGSYRGRSTAALAWGARQGHDAPVYAIEPHEEFAGVFGGYFGPKDRRAFYRNMLSSGAWENVRLVNLSSEVVTPGWDKPVGMLWIDGDHRYEGVKRDFTCWEPHLLPGAPVLFDDTDRGGPQQLVDELLEQGWEQYRKAGKVRALRRTR
jgi:predicted O-methyltransferase YrrM